MSKAGPVDADRLKSLVERVERLEEERHAIGADVRDVYAEAKGVGYDVPAMRRLVQARKLDAADRAERETLDDVYRHALGMAVAAVSNGDVSLRQAARQHGVSKSSIHRALAVPEVSREMVEDDFMRAFEPPARPIITYTSDKRSAAEIMGDMPAHLAREYARRPTTCSPIRTFPGLRQQEQARKRLRRCAGTRRACEGSA